MTVPAREVTPPFLSLEDIDRVVAEMRRLGIRPAVVDGEEVYRVYPPNHQPPFYVRATP